ncbi:hypothetical protein [Thalassotalea sp. SU-HH00458]|uniref:general secretion pathway protein GspK n=1 Tax=Thalassotalea sp. SU-HH00458 TaxID=3127657 RepID=UPI003106C2FD
MSYTSANQKGMALIQVLIIAIILTMLGIFINQTIGSQIKTAQLIKSNHHLDLLLESTEAELIHALLTQKRYKDRSSLNEWVKSWNFHGEVFHLNDNVSIQMQDLNGLLSLNYMSNSVALRLFSQLGFTESDVRIFLDSLKDWKDEDDLKHLNGAESYYYDKERLPLPRNNFLQSIDEVMNIKGANILTQEQWRKYFSIALVSQFNPLNSSPEIIKAFIDNDRAFTQVMSLRSQQRLNTFSFYQATGIEADNFITFLTGSIINIKITVTRESNQLSKSFQVELRPIANLRPITISNVKWNE